VSGRGGNIGALIGRRMELRRRALHGVASRLATMRVLMRFVAIHPQLIDIDMNKYIP
jgi:hypothetical protein